MRKDLIKLHELIIIFLFTFSHVHQFIRLHCFHLSLKNESHCERSSVKDEEGKAKRKDRDREGRGEREVM